MEKPRDAARWKLSDAMDVSKKLMVKEEKKKTKAQNYSLPRQDIITALVRSCMHDTPVGIRPI